jgi:hypothetical protein
MLQHQRRLNVFLIYALVFCVGICVPSWKRRYSSYDVAGKASRVPANSFQLSGTPRNDLGDEIGSSSSHPATTRRETDGSPVDEVSIIEGRAKFTLSTANVASMMCGSNADEIRFCGEWSVAAHILYSRKKKASITSFRSQSNHFIINNYLLCGIRTFKSPGDPEVDNRTEEVSTNLITPYPLITDYAIPQHQNCDHIF